MAMKVIKVLLADDHPALRAGIKELVQPTKPVAVGPRFRTSVSLSQQRNPLLIEGSVVA